MMLGYSDIIYLFHFLFIGPLLIYMGYYKNDTPPPVFKLILIFGIVVTLYHAYSFAQSMYFKSKLKVI